jgi:acyl-CoA thioesterase-2
MTVALEPTSATFTAAVTLELAAAEHFDLAFTAYPQPCPWPKAYGGDMVAQAAAAVMRSVTDGKILHSFHTYFLRPVEIGTQVRYEVELLRDGRGYSTRQVRGYQTGKPVFAALASFAAADVGPSFTPEILADLPGPEQVPSSADYLTGRTDAAMTDEARAYWSSGRSFDMRHMPGPVYLQVEGHAQPHQAVWVKPFDPLRPVPGLSEEQRDIAALAYVCDYTILESVLRVLNLPWVRPGLVTASLDHAMWFHRRPPAGLNEWLLYIQDAGAADAGRGLGIGRFFTRDHRHLATVVQEGMIRPPAA